jgi:hypothetical protein
MATIFRTTDPRARVSLPKAFANTTVIIEQISDTEVRIRKAQVIPEDEIRFSEGIATVLTDRDRDRFLAALDDPPPPSKALRREAAGYKKRHHGRVDSSTFRQRRPKP